MYTTISILVEMKEERLSIKSSRSLFLFSFVFKFWNQIKQYLADISILANVICQGVDLTGCHKAVQWQGNREDYVMVGKQKQFLFMSHRRSKPVNSEFEFFSTSKWNRSRKQWCKLYMIIEISQMFSTLNHSQTTKKLHTQYHTRFHVFNVVRISKILYSKMEGKSPREKIKKSVQRTFRFRFEKFRLRKLTKCFIL